MPISLDHRPFSIRALIATHCAILAGSENLPRLVEMRREILLAARCDRVLRGKSITGRCRNRMHWNDHGAQHEAGTDPRDQRNDHEDECLAMCHGISFPVL